MHYFGRWGRKQGDRIVPVEDVKASAREAVDLYNEQRDDLYAGRVPRPKEDGYYTLRTLCNEFLTAKMNKVESGELSRHTHADYERTCGRMITHFGLSRRVDDLRPDDFETFRKKLAGELSVVTLGNVVNRCRIILKWASDQRKIAEPVHFGQSFEKPSAKVLRRARNTAGKDQVAVDAIMGHVDNSMAARYREEIADDRLRALVDHVHAWLFGTGEQDDDQTADQEKDQVADREDDE